MSEIGRVATGDVVIRAATIRSYLPIETLAWMGSIALAFNEAEDKLYTLFAMCVGLENNFSIQILSRVGGIPDRAAIVKLAFENLNPPQVFVTRLRDTLGEGEFFLLKRYRDQFAHMRALSSPDLIAITNPNRGKIREILISDELLEGVYQRLELIGQELTAACVIAETLKNQIDARKVDGNYRNLGGKTFSECLNILVTEPQIQGTDLEWQNLRTRRLALPPLQELPAHERS